MLTLLDPGGTKCPDPFYIAIAVFLQALFVEQGLTVCSFCVCLCVCVSERSLRGMRSTKATYLLQQENKENNGRLS